MAETRPQGPIAAALRDYLEADAPVTLALLALVVAVFALEAVVAVTTPLRSTDVLATGLFGVAPRLAWPLSPVLHRGPLHVVATVTMLVAVGVPVERHWTRRRYALFLVAAGYLSVGGGALVLWVLSDQRVAFYGTSGVVYALAGFALAHLPRAHSRLTRTELLATGVGALALATVAVDPLTGPYFAPRWINGGHLTGVVLGLLAGWSHTGGCTVPARSGDHPPPTVG